MKRKLNGKLLAYLAGALLVIGISCYGIHHLQQRRNARALLRQAERAQEEGKHEQAARQLKTYLGIVPQDTDALAAYGLLLHRLATTPNARVHTLLVLEQVLRREPARHDVRRQLVDLALHPQVARFADARAHLDILLREHLANDGECEALLARCHEAGGEYEKATQLYEKAIQHAPGRIDSYVALAELLHRRLEKSPAALEVMDRLVAKNNESFRVYLARGRFLRELGQKEKAEEDIARASELAPDDADVILASARQALARGDLEPARARLTHGLALYPKNAQFYLSMADWALAARKPAEAVTVLQRGAQALPDQTELLWALANLQIQMGKEPSDELALLAKRKVPPAQQEFLRARVAINQKQWLEASQLLAKIQGELRPWPDLAKQADLYLGQCYGQLGNLDLQYAAYRRAVSVDPFWEPACLGLAAAQSALGRTDEALATYRRLLPRLPEVRLAMVRLLIAQPKKQPERWQEAERLLQEAAQAAPEQADVPILHAELFAGRGQFERARAILTEARARKPHEVDIWLALAQLAERQGKPDDARAVLGEARQQLGDRVELRLAQAWLSSKYAGADSRTDLAELALGLESFPALEQQRLLHGLASSHARLGDLKEADRLWAQLAAQSPDDLGLKLIRFDVAIQQGDEQSMTRLLAELEKLEGPDGSLRRYGRACLLIWKAKQGQRTALGQAETILNQLVLQRPTWSRVALALAEVSDLKQDAAGAIRNLQKTVELGERSPQALGRLIELLYQERRYTEAEEVLQKLPEQVGGSGAVGRLAAEVSLRRHDYDRALKLARQAVAGDSKDYRDYLWLGQFLRGTPEWEQAEPILRRATELGETVPQTWVALILHQVRAGEKKKAEAAIQEAAQKLPEDQLALTLAPCHEVLGRIDLARKLNGAALAARPQDPVTLRSVAGFYLRHGPETEAEQALRKLMALEAKAPQDAAWARRTLAIALAARGDYQLWRSALPLLGLAEDGGTQASTSVEDRRAGAVVLAALKNKRQRLLAIKLLEDLQSKQPLAADEQFLLAQLYEMTGDWPKARQQMVQVLAAGADNPRYLAYYAHTLLRRGEPSEAELWLDKLQQLPALAHSFQVVELKARLLAARGQADQVHELVKAYRENHESKPAEPLDRLALVTGLLDALASAHPAQKGYADAAQKSCRELVARQPERVLELVNLLCRHGRGGEALELCEAAWKSCPPQAVGVAAVAAVRAAAGGAPLENKVAGWLEEAARKDPKAANALLLCLADLRDFQGRYAEAEGLYRQLLARQPQNVVALNNLAFLLALRSQEATEALELLGRAVASAGPMPELLDTRAVIQMQRGQVAAAVKDLEQALSDAPLPSLCFHLAQAHQRAKDPKAAREAWRRAKSLGLEAAQLHPLERPAYQQLHQELETR